MIRQDFAVDLLPENFGHTWFLGEGAGDDLVRNFSLFKHKTNRRCDSAVSQNQGWTRSSFRAQRIQGLGETLNVGVMPHHRFQVFSKDILGTYPAEANAINGTASGGLRGQLKQSFNVRRMLEFLKRGFFVG
jgi:hypothetical protein